MKSFLRAVIRYLIYAIFFLFRLIPYRWARATVPFFVWLSLPVTARYRRVAFNNLRTAYGGGKTDEDLRSLVRQTLLSWGYNMLDLIYYIHQPEMILSMMTIEGKEHLDQALAQGRGVVALSAHFGNFPLMLCCLAGQGYPVNVILRPARDEKFGQRFFNLARERGVRMIYAIPRRTCVVEALKVLRDRGMLFILPDQNFGDSGRVFVNFFGTPAATGTGPLTFARRSQAPIVPVFTLRESDGRLRIIIRPALDMIHADGNIDEILRNTQVFTSEIETMIRRYPHEWLWFHKRWKTRPSDGDAFLK